MPDPITTLGEALKSSADAIKPMVETGARLLENLLGEPLKVSGQLMADRIYYQQWLNRATIAARAKKKMERDRIAAKVVPPGFLLPQLLTGKASISSAGYDCNGSTAPSPSCQSRYRATGMSTGMRLWMDAINSFGAVVRIVYISTGSPSGARHRSQLPV